MKLIDLTHPITRDMPAYPGTKPPQITNISTLDKKGYREKELALLTHTGTHIDSPAHILQNGITLDIMPLHNFYGNAIVLDFTKNNGKQILLKEIELLDHYKVDFVIFYTGWYHKWGRPEYFDGYPIPAPEVAEYLTRRGIKGVGIDTISIDPADAVDYEIHKILLNNNIIILENLTNLAEMVGRIFTLACFPLKIADSDGSPVRAIAIVE